MGGGLCVFQCLCVYAGQSSARMFIYSQLQDVQYSQTVMYTLDVRGHAGIRKTHTDKHTRWRG